MPTTEADPVRAQRMRMHGLLPFFIGLTIVIGIFAAATFLWGVHSGVVYGWDFRGMYTGGYLERTHPLDLFNLQAQQQVALHHISAEPVPVPFIHPAYEALLLVPFSLLPYTWAYFAFVVFNGLLAAACVFAGIRLFSVAIPVVQPRPGLMLFFFFPLYVAILQGQDSILLLLLLLLTWNETERGNDWKAGLFLGLALFKVQLVVPLALLMVIRKGMRLLAGFLAGTLAVVLLSFLATPRAATFVHLLKGSSEAFGTLPLAMANLRGLVFAICHAHLSAHSQLVVTAIASAVLLAVVAYLMRPIGNDLLAFSVALLASVLVSYHLYPHDLMVLAIPILAIAREMRRWRNALVFLLYLSPWVFFWAGNHLLYLTALPVAIALGAVLIGAPRQVDAVPARA